MSSTISIRRGFLWAAGRNISANEVSAAIAANNFQAAAGQAKGFLIVSNVQTNTDLRNVDQFKRMIIKSKDGGFVGLDPAALGQLVRHRVVIDARNCLDADAWRAAGWTVHGLGRGPREGVEPLSPIRELAFAG